MTKLLNKLKLQRRRITTSISDYIQAIIIFGANLIGLKLVERRWDTSQLVIAGWCFLIGLPLGFVFIGTSFSFMIWASIVISVLILSNIDNSFEQAKTKRRQRKTKKEPQCLYTCA